jgi:hypothetical protein
MNFCWQCFIHACMAPELLGCVPVCNWRQPGRPGLRIILHPLLLTALIGCLWIEVDTWASKQKPYHKAALDCLWIATTQDCFLSCAICDLLMYMIWNFWPLLSLLVGLAQTPRIALVGGLIRPVRCNCPRPEVRSKGPAARGEPMTQSTPMVSN